MFFANKMDLPAALTSVAAETMFARVKRRADRGGISRHDSLAGAVACKRSGTSQWCKTKANADGLVRYAVKRLREGFTELVTCQPFYTSTQLASTFTHAQCLAAEVMAAATRSMVHLAEDYDITPTFISRHVRRFSNLFVSLSLSFRFFLSFLAL